MLFSAERLAPRRSAIGVGVQGLCTRRPPASPVRRRIPKKEQVLHGEDPGGRVRLEGIPRGSSSLCTQGLRAGPVLTALWPR